MFEYYVAIADAMVPHIAGRPVTRKRWPNGVGQPDFFEKQLASSAPDWLQRGSVTHKSGTTTYPIIDTREGLAWIAQQASLEVHVPQWRFVSGGEPGPATRIVFDLDPGEGVTFRQLCEVAHEVRGFITDIGLTTYPLTSGSKGLHLYVPLADPVSSQGASVLAKRIAQQLEKSMPKQVTATMTKSLRAGQGVRRLEPEQRREDHDRAVFDAGARGADRRGAAHVGGDRGSRSAAPALRRGARARRDATVTCSAGWTRTRRCRTSSPRTAACAMPARRRSPCRTTRRRRATTTRSSSRSTTPRRLHYDFRLERNGVLVSWAVPKNLPETTSVNHLAVHTEDHPLEYATFEGSIPKGEYGGGKVIVWDSGTYETEKFRDNPPDGPAKGGEVIVTLHGSKVSGRYALIQTDGKNWLAHRMKEQHAAHRRRISRRCWRPTDRSQKLTSAAVGVRGQVGRLPAAGRRRSRCSSSCVRAAAATSPPTFPNSGRWQPISPITT